MLENSVILELLSVVHLPIISDLICVQNVVSASGARCEPRRMDVEGAPRRDARRRDQAKVAISVRTRPRTWSPPRTGGTSQGFLAAAVVTLLR